MTRIVIVGSGASGVHFALTALRNGHDVTMLDVGHQRPPAVKPDATFEGLKDALEDPVAHFLGEDCEGVVYPATKASYYGHPPSKSYVFAQPRQFVSRATAMQPVFSFARGGLAEAWTAGAYPLNAQDLAEFPFGYEDLAPSYQEVARRIGVAAERDDLAKFIPFDGIDYQPPLTTDPHTRHLLAVYGRQRTVLNKSRFYLGRSRVATLSRDHAGRKACNHLGRCFWGCPTDSIYSPSVTLRECQALPRFRYEPGMYVSHFEYDEGGRISRIGAEGAPGGEIRWFEGDTFVLAAGALCSSKIVLDSIYRRTGRVVELPGLMDNRQVHVPFLTPRMIAEPVNTAAYQFHHLAFGIERDDPAEYVHGQITTLKAASVHPILLGMPLDFKTALTVFRGIRTGLGLANVNLHDRRRATSVLTIRPTGADGRSELLIRYETDPNEHAHRDAAVRDVKRALSTMGCIVPPGMTRVLPMGSSVHYAGTLPMTAQGGTLTCTPDCRSRDFPNLYLADGATLPFLPSKNLTFTLMANAIRIAETLRD
ncbi:MAG: GMC oxidoreductase [Gemmatimonadota bacterium]